MCVYIYIYIYMYIHIYILCYTMTYYIICGLEIKAYKISSRGSRIPEPLLMLTSKCPLRIEIMRADRRPQHLTARWYYNNNNNYILIILIIIIIIYYNNNTTNNNNNIIIIVIIIIDAAAALLCMERGGETEMRRSKPDVRGPHRKPAAG